MILAQGREGTDIRHWEYLADASANCKHNHFVSDSYIVNGILLWHKLINIYLLKLQTDGLTAQ